MDFLRWLESKKREIGFSHNVLIIIAMLTMLLDHIAYVLIQNGKLYGYDAALYANAISLPEARPWLILYKLLRMIGRISFPIYSFLIVEGFVKTSNYYKYLMRILFFALISEIPFDLMIYNRFLAPECLATQNVLFTYFIGLQMLEFIKLLSFLPEGLSLILVAVSAIVCYILKTDYWLEGILLIYVFYIFRYDTNVMYLCALIIAFVSTFKNYFGFGVFSVFFIYFYDGQKGYLDLKRFHYLFYPIHMIVLYGILYFSYWNAS